MECVFQVIKLIHRQFSVERLYSLLVAGSMVVVAQQLIFLQLSANHTQQVVIKNLGISPQHHKGCQVFIFRFCQQMTQFGCQFGFLNTQFQSVVLLVHLPQHRLINGSQHRVFADTIVGHDAIDGRLQRVGCDVSQHLCTIQFSLQQLSILLFGLCLRSYLL